MHPDNRNNPIAAALKWLNFMGESIPPTPVNALTVRFGGYLEDVLAALRLRTLRRIDRALSFRRKAAADVVRSRSQLHAGLLFSCAKG